MNNEFMGRITIYREKGFEFMPVYIEINKEMFLIGRGEKKEINLPAGKYKIHAQGWLGLKGYKEVDIKENEPVSLLLTQIISPEISVIGASILLLIGALMYIDVVSVRFTATVVLIMSTSLFLCPIIGRKKYFRFKPIHSKTV